MTVTEVETVNGSGSAYRYRLACDGGGTVSVTRSDRTLRVDQGVRVRHDPEGRSDKAELVGDTEGMKPQDIAWTAAPTDRSIQAMISSSFVIEISVFTLTSRRGG